MSLPTPLKTWKYQVNNRTTGGTLNAAASALMLAVKQGIKGEVKW